MKLLKQKKSQVFLYIVFIIMALLIVIIASVFAPMGVLFNTRMYEAGEGILLRANNSIADIDNSDVRTSIYSMLDNSFKAQENNIDVNNSIFQYSWVIVIVLIGLVIFLYTRRMVEISGGGFVG